MAFGKRNEEPLKIMLRNEITPSKERNESEKKTAFPTTQRETQ